MNQRQLAFFRQASSDWSVFCHLRPQGRRLGTSIRKAWCAVVGVWPFSFPQCHELHYLQMCTEKLAKAYYAIAPGRTGHDAFRKFMRDLPRNSSAIGPLGFSNLRELISWQRSVLPLVGAIEDLAPSIADRLGLPNPEYPWPRHAPTQAPADYSFGTEIYALLDAQAKGGGPPFLKILDKMVRTMQSAGWHL